MNTKLRKHMKFWLRAFVIALICACVTRAFFFQSFRVCSPAMENTLSEGDYIFVNKINHGARIPVTILSIPLLYRKIPFTDIPSYSGLIQLPYYRFPAFSRIKRNSLLVFNTPMESNLPLDKQTRHIRRCVALPNDTLQINRDEIFINKKNLRPIKTSCFTYRFRTRNKKLVDSLKQAGKIMENKQYERCGIYQVNLGLHDVRELSKDSSIAMQPVCYSNKMRTPTSFAKYGKYYWNPDYLGPLVIPYKGQEISINENNIAVYQRIVEVYENNTLEIKDGKIFINGKECDKYTIKNNYYFVLSDNRNNTTDSRHWGFLPESHIIGSVSFYLSFNK